MRQVVGTVALIGAANRHESPDRHQHLLGLPEGGCSHSEQVHAGWGSLSVSVITVAELKVWQLRSSLGTARSQAIVEMYQDRQLLDVGQEVAMRYAEIRASLLDVGRTIPVLDLLIAATALVHDLILVTHNVKDFAFVPGLTVVDWLEP